MLCFMLTLAQLHPLGKIYLPGGIYLPCWYLFTNMKEYHPKLYNLFNVAYNNINSTLTLKRKLAWCLELTSVVYKWGIISRFVQKRLHDQILSLSSSISFVILGLACHKKQMLDKFWISLARLSKIMDGWFKDGEIMCS